MKRFLLIPVFIFLVGSSLAQTTLTVAVDFTVTDTQGNPHNLFNILNSGKHVCIDFFFTTCGPCQATAPHYKQTFSNYGCNTQDVYFISIDLGDTDAQCIGFEQTYLGGNAGYPVVSGVDGGGDAVVNAYGINAFPTYILIAPNHNIVEQDMWPITGPADFDTYFSAHGLTQKTCLTTGLKPSAQATEFSFFPNPAKDQVRLTFPRKLKQEISLYDIQGRQLMNSETEELNYTVDLKDFSGGVYFISVKNAEGTSKEKIVIQK